MKNLKGFTNVFGNKVEYKPFYQKQLNTWYVSRYENGELETVQESLSYYSFNDCEEKCNILKSKFSNQERTKKIYKTIQEINSIYRKQKKLVSSEIITEICNKNNISESNIRMVLGSPYNLKK